MNHGANKQRNPEHIIPIRLGDGLSHEIGCVILTMSVRVNPPEQQDNYGSIMPFIRELN